MRITGAILCLLGILLVYSGLRVTEPDESNYQPEYTAELDFDTSLELYLYACDFVQGQFADFAEAECPSIPVVIFRKMRDRLHGYYTPGSHVVWLSDKFAHQFSLSIFGEGIAVHEMVHYLLYEYDLMQDDVEFCREENLAWVAANTWVEDKDRDEDSNTEWWDWYESCDGPHGDPKTSIKAKLQRIFT